jgi:meiotic recombination protein DMC1
MAIFRVDYVARGELSERQQTLNQFLSRLRKIAEEFNVAVVLTNQVQSDPGGMAFAGVEPKKAIGGHVLAHASTIRLMVRKGRAEARVLKVLQGPTLKEDEAEFQITEGGVTGME